MKYYIANEFGTVYFLRGDTLCGVPMNQDDTFDTDEWFEVDLLHDEMPDGYYFGIMKKLNKANML